MRISMTYLLVVVCVGLKAQRSEFGTEPTRDRYLSEQKAIGQSFSGYFTRTTQAYTGCPRIGLSKKSIPPGAVFPRLLHTYSGKLDPAYVRAQEWEIKYYFDRLLIEYPNNHETYTESGRRTYSAVERVAAENQDGFNNPALLADEDFTAYVRSFLNFRMTDELTKETYDGHYNKYLEAW